MEYRNKEKKALSKLRVCKHSLLRSGYLDIKDAECAETIDVLKKSYHTISRF